MSGRDEVLLFTSCASTFIFILGRHVYHYGVNTEILQALLNSVVTIYLKCAYIKSSF